MKRILTAILVLIYFAGSTGAIISRHYCMGRLSNWSLGQVNEMTCGSCGMDKGGNEKNGCCDDEYHFVKTVTDHQSNLAVSVNIPVTECFSVDHNDGSINMIVLVRNTPSVNHHHPPVSGPPIFIRNRVFRL